ncbi:uncharacterized protein PV09_04930 [Verruconis gallopava]|uniref:FAR-17a/AIG1-like protein n=1 Tax=Verruconis gallopava TaxID=253628 RepID=A0A0D2AC83_9PEZI|nr:uncharacterized protein PV09_04930 [Verruconis gallopava]KIW04120.1 hypothetical protein PV09_04930 [Verruconis gallopava]
MGIWDAGSGGPFDAVRFSTSWIVPPVVLFALRALISLFIFTSIFTILGIDDKVDQEHYFSYFTSLTFWGLGFYFLFAAIHTASYWLTGKPFLARWPRALQIAHSMYYTTITTFPFVVTIIFWALLFSSFPNVFSVFSNVSQHVLNTVFCLFEIFVPRTLPTPWIHLVTLVLILLLYLGLAFVTWGTEHFYVYDFLDDRLHSRGVIAGYIFGILALTIVIFVVVHFVLLGRVKLTENKWGKTGKLATKGRTAGAGDAELAEPMAEKA